MAISAEDIVESLIKLGEDMVGTIERGCTGDDEGYMEQLDEIKKEYEQMGK